MSRARDRLDEIVDEHATAMTWPQQRAEGYRTARATGLALALILTALLAAAALAVSALSAHATTEGSCPTTTSTTSAPATTDLTSRSCGPRSETLNAAATAPRSVPPTPRSSELEVDGASAEVLDVDHLPEVLADTGGHHWVAVAIAAAVLVVQGVLLVRGERTRRSKR